MARPRVAHLGVLLVVLATGCAGGDGTAHSDVTRGSADAEGNIDPAMLEPLTAMGPCDDPPPGGPDVDGIDGLVLPPTTVVTELSDGGPLTQVRGYIERTPVEVRAFYAEEGSGMEVLTIEDEVREAEVLVTDGTTRLFVKAQAVCERGSVFVGFLAPEGEGERLPVPAQGGN